MMKRLMSFLVIALVWAFSGAQTATAQQACQFVVMEDDAAMYNAPLPYISQQIGVLPEGTIYPVLKETPFYLDSFVLLKADQDELWALRRQGELQGDCSRLPVDDSPVTDFPAVCTFTITPSESGGLTLPVIGFEDGKYLLWEDHAHSRWADRETGVLGGACANGEITATTRENARLWTMPDALAGRMLFSLAPNTQVTILAGPVQGAIRIGSTIKGDWYHVMDAQGRIGWVWAGRLMLDSSAGTSTR